MNRRKTEKRRGERKGLFWMERERLREKRRSKSTSKVRDSNYSDTRHRFGELLSTPLGYYLSLRRLLATRQL